MPSLEGLKTWFDYEILIIALALTVVVAASVITQIAASLARLPLTSPEFALTVTASGLGTILFLIVLAGRYNWPVTLDWIPPHPRPIFKVTCSNCTDNMNEPRVRGVVDR